MPDPIEGVEPDGTIRTGVRRDRVPPEFEALVVAATRAVDAAHGSLYLYGSVANGTARPGTSDVDLLAIDVTDAPGLALSLTRDFAGLSRGVEVSVSVAQDFLGDADEAYGNRVFLRHYCVHLAGPDQTVGLPRFPADVRAARGFNGDVGRALHDGGVVPTVVRRFADLIGLWQPEDGAGGVRH